MDSVEKEMESVVNEKAQKAGEELTNGILLDQLEELEEQKTKLLLNLKEYKEKYEQQKSDQTDIYYYLNKKLDENYETIASLEEQILNEQTQREIQEKRLEKRIEELNLKVASDETKYLTKLNEAEEKLQKLKEFSDNKDVLEKNFDKLLETLETERIQYRELMDENERKSIRERDRFRKDCEQQYEDYKQKLQEEADDKLSSKAKKTLKTNKMIKTELLYQSKQADQVLVYNQKVLDKDRELRQELELTQTTQKEMVKRLALYQRLIKQLNEKVSSKESQLREVTEESQLVVKTKDEEIEVLQQQLKQCQINSAESRPYNQDLLFDFLCLKYKEIVNKDTNKGFRSVNSDAILNELLVHGLKNFPERFAEILDEKVSSGAFPPISLRNSSENDFASNNHNKLTGISAWDSARSKSRQNWWSGFSKEVESDIRDQGSLTSQTAIQTEGRIMHYPADSKWLNTKSSQSGAKSVPSKFFVNHEGRRVKKKRTFGANRLNNSSSGDQKLALSSDDEIIHGSSSSGIFSPMNDPLHRLSKNR